MKESYDLDMKRRSPMIKANIYSVEVKHNSGFALEFITKGKAKSVQAKEEMKKGF